MKVFVKSALLVGISMAITACGGGGSSTNTQPTNTIQPTTPIKPTNPATPNKSKPVQPVKLPDNFTYNKEPLAEIKSQPLYNFDIWVNENPIKLYSYSFLAQTSNNIFKSTQYSTHKYSSNWSLDNVPTLVFNIAQNQWVESDNALTVSEGLVGSEGVKTIHVSSDTGVKYYTLIEKDLSGLTLDKGLSKGFGEGRDLPKEIYNRTFSQGAKAYAWVQDITQPVYEIYRTHYVFTTRNETKPIHVCENITNYCSATANTLETAINQKGWYQNGGKNASIRIIANGQALLTVRDEKQNKDLTYPLTYKLNPAKQGQPKHIVFNTQNTTVKSLLQENFNIGDSDVAWYEYGNKVVKGSYMMPTMGLQSNQYSYNKIAINDILTKWSPSKRAVLE